MRNNEELQHVVQEGIKWEPLLKAAKIGVRAEEGVVTLTGVVDSYPKKVEAENAAQSVHGVKVVVEKIEIKFVGVGRKPDNEIAKEVVNALAGHWKIPNHNIKIKVEDDLVTLEGEVHWNYQRVAIHKAMDNIKGLSGISIEIKIKAESNDGVEKEAIERGLSRSSILNAKEILVQVEGNEVIHSVCPKMEFSAKHYLLKKSILLLKNRRLHG